MLVLFPSLAILALVAGSVVSGIGARRDGLAPRAQRTVLALVWAAALASGLGVLWFLRMQADWTHWAWFSAADPFLRPFGLGAWSDLAASPPAWSRVFAGGPALDFDLRALLLLCALNWPLALLLLLYRPPLVKLGWPLLIAAASALFVLSSGSPLGTVAAWLLLDGSLFGSGFVHRRGLLASQMGLWLLVAALAALPIDHETLRPGDGAVWEAAWQQLRPFLLWAAYLRMGLFPFTWTLPSTPDDQLWRLAPARIAPMLAGMALVLRAATPSLASEAPYLSVVALGLVALLASSLLIRGAQGPGASLDKLGMVSGALALLAAALPARVSPDLVVGLALELALGRSLMVVGAGRIAARAAWPWTLGSLSAIGMAGTLGFALRGPLVAVWFEQLSAPWGVALLLGLTLATWAWPRTLGGAEPAARGPSSAVARLLMAGYLLLGLLATSLLFAGRPTLLSAAWPSGRTNLDEQGWAALLLPLALGGLLRRYRSLGDPLSGRWKPWGQVPRLADLYDAWRSALIQAGRVLHRSVNLMDSRRTMAWTLFAALVIALSMLSVPSGFAPYPAGVAWAPAILAAGLSLFVLQAERPLTQMAGLAGAQLLGVWLVASGPAHETLGDPWVIAPVKLLTGWVVLGILAVGTIEHRRSLDAGSRPLAALLERHRSVVDDRRLLLGAATLGFVLVLGVQSSTLADALPLDLLRPALLLVCAGLLGTVFAEAALRLACCAYLAFIGLELIYARLDPGLLITGGLAVFQILFALLIAGYIGLDLGPAEQQGSERGS